CQLHRGPSAASCRILERLSVAETVRARRGLVCAASPDPAKTKPWEKWPRRTLAVEAPPFQASGVHACRAPAFFHRLGAARPAVIANSAHLACTPRGPIQKPKAASGAFAARDAKHVQNRSRTKT